MTDITEFTKRQDEIYARIDSIGKRANPDVGCFHDGVSFPEKYLAEKTKVMWVLKNSYDEVDESGNAVSDGMNIRDWFSDGKLDEVSKKQIFVKMALASYCIQNGFPYSESLRSKKSVFMGSLQSIALLDLSKLPGRTSITDKELRNEFMLFKDVVSSQIDLYAPDVMIFGNSLHVCRELFGGLSYTKPDGVQTVNDDCLVRKFSVNKRTLLECYHPSYSITYETYIGTILSALGIS